MNIFTAPFFALFSLNFYRRVLQSSIWKGISYLLYLSLIGAVLMVFRGIPVVNDFMTWFKSEMPSLTWTQEGLQIKGESPYVMTHPALGTFAIFDTTKAAVGPAEIGETLLYVTSTKLYLRQGPNDIAAYDLTRPTGTAGAQRPAKVEVTPEFIERSFNAFKPWFILLSFAILYLVFFITQLLTAIIYSLIGLLFNLMRKTKLRYRAVLNASAFTLTAAWIVQIVRVLVPAIAVFPFGMIGSFLVTTLYLFFAIKLTDSPQAAAQ